MKNIIKYNGLIDAIVVNRPSKTNKSPYLNNKVRTKIPQCNNPFIKIGDENGNHYNFGI